MKKNTITLQIGMLPRMVEFFQHPSKRKILQKGRRVGGTINAIFNIMKECIEGKNKTYLWIDTTYRMLQRYWGKYWYVEIRKLPKNLWNFNKTQMELDLFGSKIFFKSYDNIESIEGDAYDAIYVNECGFLLKDSELWEQSLAPMLLDTNGEAVFIGTPKSGKNSFHFELINKIERGALPDWHLMKLTTFDNPYIKKEVIDSYINTIDPDIVKTEIYGEFPDASLVNFFYQFRFEKHVCNLNSITQEPVYLSFDFNVNPMTAIVFFVRQKGIDVIHEFYLENMDIFEMCELIKKKYPFIAAITGDASGNSRSGNVKGLLSYYDTIMNRLNLKRSQIKVPASNPTHHNSRVLCNAILYRGNIKVNATCKHLIEDLTRVQVKESSGEIDKSNAKLTHVGDCFRYAINAFCNDFIKDMN